MKDYSSLKLLIWDLDDTFWQGTLSEGGVVRVDDNIKLLHILDDHGVINSICSKNNKDSADKELEVLGVKDLFVFNSIDWSPKGPRIETMIREIGLRPVNCLFVDDNPVNRNEALHYVPGLSVISPEELSGLKDYFKDLPATDLDHSRRSRYHVLEEKQSAKKHFSDNLDFLYQSETIVVIDRDCISHIDRIEELVNRTNQLNFTKVRSSKEELEVLCKRPDVDSGCVYVRDKYGDYGIVGFFAIKDGRCLHFLFSCRTIGQGVEQYVYAFLNYPSLDVVGEVVNSVTHDPAPMWINQIPQGVRKTREKLGLSSGNVILKGGCDLRIMSQYLSTESVIEEFTYIGQKRKNNIEHINHSVNYLSFPFLNEKDRDYFLLHYPFSDEDMFETAMFRDDVRLLIISTMSEPNLGVYERNSDGLRFAWGEYKFPLTDSNNWEGYITGALYTAHNDFSLEWLKWFTDNHSFCGRLNSDEIITNYRKLLKKTNPLMKICFILGSETPYLNNDKLNYEGRELDYADLNKKMRVLSKENERVLLIDLNDFIKGQEDFNDNINHFKRRVYFEMASKANDFIEELTGVKLKQKSRFYLFYKSLIDEIGFTGFFQTKLWTYLRKPYAAIKSFIK